MTPRTFRIDRISSAEILEERFEPPGTIDSLDLVLRSIASIPGTYQVEVWLDTTLAFGLAHVSPTFGRVHEQDGGVILRCQMDDLDNLARYIVNLGVPFRVLQPDELRAAFGTARGGAGRGGRGRVIRNGAPAFQLPGSPGNASSSASRVAASSRSS